ncbi:MAG TPA: hypothetical protein VFB16_04865 [Bauldia sp.]|nr:hypothetical protein [Bauldia sp.]
MKILATIISAAALAAIAVQPAAALSKSYCADKARHVANAQAAGKTIVGAGLGCLFGQLISKKCGVGAAIGGVGGFAIGSAKWHQVYDRVYWNCRHS